MELHNNLIDTFAEFKELKSIDRPTMIGVLKDVFTSTLTKLFGEESRFDVIVNDTKGDVEIWRTRMVVKIKNLRIRTPKFHYQKQEKSMRTLRLVRNILMK
jgi:hypothetical protein